MARTKNTASKSLSLTEQKKIAQDKAKAHSIINYGLADSAFTPALRFATVDTSNGDPCQLKSDLDYFSNGVKSPLPSTRPKIAPIIKPKARRAYPPLRKNKNFRAFFDYKLMVPHETLLKVNASERCRQVLRSRKAELKKHVRNEINKILQDFYPEIGIAPRIEESDAETEDDEDFDLARASFPFSPPEDDSEPEVTKVVDEVDFLL